MTPRWFTLLCIVSVLPIGLTPAMIASARQGSPMGTLSLLFPIFLVASACLAWHCYRDRRDLAWILLAMSLLTSLAMTVPLFT